MKCLKWFAAIAISTASIAAHAGNISATTIMDNYIGAGQSGDIHGEKNDFDIDKMEVSRVGTTLTVNIFTAFYDNIGINGVRLGDLFLAAGDNNVWQPFDDTPNAGDRFSANDYYHNTGTDWQYAFDLGAVEGNRRNAEVGGQYTGWLRDVNRADILDSHQVYSNGTTREYQAVMMNGNYYNPYSASTWSVGNWAYNKNGIDYGAISFSMDVSGTALATANQIAFRWAMSCANDIIEGFASATPSGGGTPIPEPQSMLLMLLGLLGLAYKKRAKNT
ncbi:PEP-CTERM sorting domain-containing protein [Thalassotalea ganghwensis]